LTLPPSLSELDAESGSEPDLSRVTLVVGGLHIDVGLPTNLSIATFINDVIDIANEHMATQPALASIEFDNTEGKWTLARLGADAIDPGRSLTEANIYDGELLAIREIGRPTSPLLFDDLFGDLFDDLAEVAEVADQPDSSAIGRLFHDTRMLTCFGVGLVAAISAAVLLPRRVGDVGAASTVPYSGPYIAPYIAPYLAPALLGIGIVGVVVACVISYRSRSAHASEWAAAVAAPLVFAGSLYVVPDGFGAKSLPMAFGLTAWASLVVLLVTGRGRCLHTAVIALSAIGGVSATATLLWHPAPRASGAVLATVSVIVVYLSPRVTVLVSRLPIPRVPTAGEPLDDIETQGGTTVEGVNALGKQIIPTEEGMLRRVRRANQHLTGILVATAITAAVGCYFAVDVTHGFYWQGTAFAVTVAAVLCLRGRSHHDLVQSATLIGGGMAIALTVVVKWACLDGWQLNAALALVMLMALVIVCGVVAPSLEFSPVMRRAVEILEYVAIALVFPLCCWIIRLYAFFRELRI
jgi:type VII secretion integral membrane protein EccD